MDAFDDGMDIEQQVDDKRARDRVRKNPGNEQFDADQLGQPVQGDDIQLINKEHTGVANDYELEECLLHRSQAALI